MDRVAFEDVLAVARGEIGYTESPADSNRTKYGAWFGLDGQPWCMMFIMWIFAQAGGYEMPPAHTGSCSALMRAAQSEGSWVTEDYRPGDVVIYDFPNTQYKTDHCGFVWQVLEDGGVMAIEGNTSVGNDSNGGEVMARIRSASLILGAWRPDWKEVTRVSLNNNIPDEYAKEAVKWAQDNGILTGTASGDLNLHQPCTRQQLLVFLWRFARLIGKA